MIIVRANVLGMCMGVRRAEDAAKKAAGVGKSEERNVFTYGPLIHNPQAVAALEGIGLSVLDPDKFDSDELDEKSRGSIVVIRAHGAPPDAFNHMEKLGITIVDATCPRVLKSQKKARELLDRGYSVAIAGDRSHGEVAGIVGHAPGAVVVENAEEAKTLAEAWVAKPIALIAQTTIKKSEYDAIVDQFERSSPSFLAVETLCPATADRQKALADLAEKVDALIIVGGRNSANTQRLFMAAKESGKPSWHIETGRELPGEIFSFEKVGLSAGASTPDSVIDEVERFLLEGGK
ncbi:MAG: 4-hydroxy-3-methylbut-2-enyl diphosphate reductase [Rectinemataceae bacterium]